MKRYVKGIVIILIAASLTSCGSKDGGESPKNTVGEAGKENPVTANKTGIFELEGGVSNINTISNTFTLRTKDGDVEVYVRAMSRIMENGERKPLSALKDGSYAKGTFKKWDGKDTVMEIIITQGK
ncbi:MAG: hypothetical protein HY266_04485 [Deltaproteobacteria bacterium]|nr:hypothetical protein [Deltaproteobacteria bacterium]